MDRKERPPRRHSGRLDEGQAGRGATRAALDRMATEDPELAARLFVQMLPAAAQRLEGPLSYDLTVEGLGTWHVSVDGNGGGARVERGSGGEVDFELIADAAGIAALPARQRPL